MKIWDTFDIDGYHLLAFNWRNNSAYGYFRQNIYFAAGKNTYLRNGIPKSQDVVIKVLWVSLWGGQGLRKLRFKAESIQKLPISYFIISARVLQVSWANIIQKFFFGFFAVSIWASVQKIWEEGFDPEFSGKGLEILRIITKTLPCNITWLRYRSSLENWIQTPMHFIGQNADTSRTLHGE